MNNIQNHISLNNLKKELQNRKMTNCLYFFEQTSSTFDESEKLGAKNGDIVCAKVQTSGRGRMGREWKSDAGGIYFSYVTEPDLPPDKMQIITAICAVAVQKALSAYSECYVKWPNDIVSKSGKKLCGILSKSVIKPNSPILINVGIGINANNFDFGEDLPYASCLKTECGHEVDENAVLCDVVQNIEYWCQKDAECIIKEFEKICINIGSTVKAVYHENGNTIEGKCTGLSPDGALIIQTDSETMCVNSGEVSVRGIYGYV